MPFFKSRNLSKNPIWNIPELREQYFVFLIFFCSGGPVVICIVGLKLLRSSFSDSSRQHVVLLWTVLFFHFDYSHSSETFVVDYFFMSIFMSKVNVRVR